MSLASTSSMPVTVFLSYAREDKRLLKKLLSHLGALQRVQAVQYWYNNYVTPGEPYQHEVAAHLQSAQIILLLLSPDFMAQCWDEMELALEQRKNEGAQVIPVLLRPGSNWEGTSLGKLAPLPDDRRSVSLWRVRDLAYDNIAHGVGNVIAAIRASMRQHRPPSRLIEQPPSLLTQPRVGTVKKLYTQLIAADTSAIILTGIVGAGLSTLANLLYHYAEEQRDTGNGPFTTQPLKVRIDRTTSLVELVETIFDALGESLPDDSARSSQDLVVLLFHTLQKLEQPRLLILDQFELLLEQGQNEACQTLLHLFNTSPCQSRVLLISHLKLSDAEQEHYLHEFHSDGLETEEGVELLRSARSDAPTADLQAIVEHLGGHATALSLLVPLLRDHKQLPMALLKEHALQTPLENSVRSLEELYTHQLDDRQRTLLCAFSIYREPVPLDAALVILDRSVAQASAVSALNKLQALYLLRANTHGYQLPTLIANYAYSRAVEALQDRQATLQNAHEKAAAYYRQQLSASSRQMPEIPALIHNGVEASWHLCQAQQWQSAYTLLVQEDIYTYLLRWGRSIALLELCQQLLSAWHAQPQQEAYLLKEAGKAYDRLGRKREAQRHFEQALPLFQAVRDRQNEASTLTHLGEIYNALAQKEQALICYQQALNICNETEAVDEHIKAIVLNDLGKLSYERGENVQALEYFKQALLLHDDTSEEATTFNNLAALYEDMGKAVEAYRAYQKARRLFREIGDRRGEGSVLHNLGRYLSKQGKIEEALEYYKSAWRIFREIGDRLSESITLRNLCQLYLVQERYRAALASLFLAKKILREMQSPQENDVQGTIALLSYQFGKERFEEAWRYFEENDLVVVESILNDAEMN